MSDETIDANENILWIGGPAAAGKTTVSRLFARTHGLLWYSIDAHAFTHEVRAVAAGLHVMDSGPGDFDRKPMILDDIQSMTLETAVVVEGAQVTPNMAGVDANALWLMPSKAEQFARLQRRHPDGAIDGYVWGWDLVRGQLEGTSATVLAVDGQSVTQTIGAVEEVFSSVLANLPSARVAAKRQRVIRLGNRQVYEHACARSRYSDLSRSRGSSRTAVFDCECGHRNCLEVVPLGIDEAGAALHQSPPSIISPRHPDDIG